MISSKTHTIIGLLVGVALLLAPWLFGFSANEAATVAALLVGVVVIINELISTSAYSPIKLIPMKTHLILDYVTGGLLLISPWLFGFADMPINAWLPHVLVGVLIIGYALATDPARDTMDHHVAA